MGVKLAPPSSPPHLVLSPPSPSCTRCRPLQAGQLLRQMQEMSGGAMLAYRRFERASMRRRLEAAAAVIASGGASASSSMQVCVAGGWLHGVVLPQEVCGNAARHACVRCCQLAAQIPWFAAHLPRPSQEEEEGGMEDPPEINDFIRELGGTLAQEAGAAPAGGLSLPG